MSTFVGETSIRNNGQGKGRGVEGALNCYIAKHHTERKINVDVENGVKQIYSKELGKQKDMREVEWGRG